MVDMGVGQQDMRYLQPLLLNILCQLCILKRCLASRVDDGTLLGGFVNNKVAVDLKMIKCKLFNHVCVS